MNRGLRRSHWASLGFTSRVVPGAAPEPLAVARRARWACKRRAFWQAGREQNRCFQAVRRSGVKGRAQAAQVLFELIVGERVTATLDGDKKLGVGTPPRKNIPKKEEGF